MAYEAICCRLTNVREHPNADRLKLATVQGYQVIVGLDAKDGDLGIFFPCDGKLSEAHLHNNNLYSKAELNSDTDKTGYFGKKGRVRAQRFRGSKSEGFWQEIECLEWTGAKTWMEDPTGGLKDGDKFTHLNGELICEKYYTPATQKAMGNKQKKKVQKVDYSNFAQHYDTKQLRDHIRDIPAGAIIYISEKLHGTSGRTGYVCTIRKPGWLSKVWNAISPREWNISGKKWEYVSGTRRTVLTKNKADGFYQDTSFRQHIHDQIKLAGLHKGETLYYEIVGFTDRGGFIMPPHGIEDKKLKKKFGSEMCYTYGREQNGTKLQFGFHIYRITMTSEDGQTVEYSWPQVVARCSELGFDIVPELMGPLIYDKNGEELVEDCLRLANGTCILDGKHIMEGVVVRVEHESMWTALKYKSFWFCELESIRKNDDNYVDPEEIA